MNPDPHKPFECTSRRIYGCGEHEDDLNSTPAKVVLSIFRLRATENYGLNTLAFEIEVDYRFGKSSDDFVYSFHLNVEISTELCGFATSGIFQHQDYEWCKKSNPDLILERNDTTVQFALNKIEI
ncbi:hypothetical protein WA026_000433 [Henosepilachna vigintioctopunctata]|uniref:Galectin n=1 Tax=Henosepilachna vigintioctopunctata TaxID=420089 RepID=A0AAW1V8C3_9CUCU